MKIAIVGSGIAGLSAAWLLGRYHEVTVFERHGRPGMGAFNLDYACGDNTVRIDVPIRAFNRCHYRNLVKFYELMGVAMQRTDHAAAYSRPLAASPYFAYQYLDIGQRSIPHLAGLRQLTLNSARIVRDVVRFLFLAKRDRHRGLTDGLTIESYLTAKNYSGAFIHDVLLPSFAAIGTCSYKAIRQYPAETVIDFLASGMLFNGIWRAKSGADDAIQRMLEHCHRQHCDTAIASIKKTPAAGGAMTVTVTDQHGKEHRFDHVVLAIQANQIAALLGDDEAEALSCLQTIGYERSEVVVHSDVSLAPGHHKKGPPVLFEVDPAHDSPMASICLNKLYPSLQHAPALFQTWNPLREPAADTVIGRAFFERPLVTPASLKGMRRLSELQRQSDRVIWYSGSYAKAGVPLLESALQSSMDIAQRLGADIPWTV